ncbi:MAG: phosphonate ABC transporter, permease protein PhnE [Rhodospirillales bacterium]|nr:phosphonate ABC transporter, permease protein PhnE [Rhodospirillales bacterium]
MKSSSPSARAGTTGPSGDAVDSFEAARAQAIRERRGRTILFTVLMILAFAASIHVGEVSLIQLLEGAPGLFNYIHDILPVLRIEHLGGDLAEWYWGLWRWLKMLWETVLLAFLGTLIGAVGAFLLCFPASDNLTSHRAVYLITRRVLEVARSVPELVYAMIFVFSFGIGPFPGVLAIAIHTVGALGKLFSEVNENVDLGPVEGVRAAGGNWFQIMRYAVVPQVLPNFLSYTLLRFEINVCGAAVIGFVGAGGIGQELMFVIRQFVYTDISAIVLMIIVTVSIIDMISEKLRHHLIGKEALA